MRLWSLKQSNHKNAAARFLIAFLSALCVLCGKKSFMAVNVLYIDPSLIFLPNSENLNFCL